MEESQNTAGGIAERLESQILKRFGTVYKFQKELEARNDGRRKEDRIKGISAPSIHAYLKGSPPSVEFLQEAAEVLGVRPAWLVFGEGLATEAEAVMQEAQPEVPDLRQVAEERFRKVFPAYDQLGYSTRAVAMEFVFRLGVDIAFRGTEEQDLDGSLIAAAAFTGRNLGALLSTLGPAEKDDIEAYVVLMCQALSRLVPAPEPQIGKRQRNTAELLERLTAGSPDPDE